MRTANAAQELPAMLESIPDQQVLFVDQPLRSKMLDAYLADITQLLSERRWPAAERASLAIPHLGVALSSSALRSSCEGYRRWCQAWIRPSLTVAFYDSLCARASHREIEFAQGVPVTSLRALRLHRNVRHIGSGTAPDTPIDAEAAAIASMCRALISAAVRWYQQAGRQEHTVQSNLIRLGILH